MWPFADAESSVLARAEAAAASRPSIASCRARSLRLIAPTSLKEIPSRCSSAIVLIWVRARAKAKARVGGRGQSEGQG